jgi:hypothetical protein
VGGGVMMDQPSTLPLGPYLSVVFIGRMGLKAQITSPGLLSFDCRIWFGSPLRFKEIQVKFWVSKGVSSLFVLL